MKEPISWEELARWLSGESSPAEIQRLEARVQRDEEARRQVEVARAIWTASGQRPSSPDVETALHRVNARLRFIESGRGPAAGNGRMRRSTPWYAMRVLAVAAVVVGAVAVALFLRSDFPRVETTPFRSVSTERGQRATLWLEDGTVVRLNAATRLAYPARFDAKERVVQLEGEAFFDVSPDANRPFRIEVEGSEVIVLGTSFGIRALPVEHQASVVVSRGSVAFRPAGHAESQVILGEGQMGILTEGSIVPRVEQVNLDSALSWLSGRMDFRNASFDRVMRELERVYDLDVRCESPIVSIANLNARFGTEPLPEILNEIGAALGLSYSSEGRVVTFRRRNAS
jgi:transmembrane sensor